jgi:hypothetical protein
MIRYMPNSGMYAPSARANKKCKFLLTNGPRATTYWGVGLGGHNSWKPAANLTDLPKAGEHMPAKKKASKKKR